MKRGQGSSRSKQLESATVADSEPSAPRTIAEMAAELGVPVRTMRHQIAAAEQFEALPEEVRSDVNAGRETLTEAATKAGAMLASTVRHQGGRPGNGNSALPFSLPDSITKMQSSRWQQTAGVVNEAATSGASRFRRLVR